jgi:uncharacterized membrane protein
MPYVITMPAMPACVLGGLGVLGEGAGVCVAFWISLISSMLYTHTYIHINILIYMGPPQYITA